MCIFDQLNPLKISANLLQPATSLLIFQTLSKKLPTFVYLDYIYQDLSYSVTDAFILPVRCNNPHLSVYKYINMTDLIPRLLV